MAAVSVSNACVICTYPYDAGARSAQLLVPCGHTFCQTCVASIDARNPICSLCRTRFSEAIRNWALSPAAVAVYAEQVRSHLDAPVAVRAAEEDRIRAMVAEANALNQAGQFANAITLLTPFRYCDRGPQLLLRLELARAYLGERNRGVASDILNGIQRNFDESSPEIQCRIIESFLLFEHYILTKELCEELIKRGDIDTELKLKAHYLWGRACQGLYKENIDCRAWLDEAIYHLNKVRTDPETPDELRFNALITLARAYQSKYEHETVSILLTPCIDTPDLSTAHRIEAQIVLAGSLNGKTRKPILEGILADPSATPLQKSQARKTLAAMDCCVLL